MGAPQKAPFSFCSGGGTIRMLSKTHLQNPESDPGYEESTHLCLSIGFS